MLLKEVLVREKEAVNLGIGSVGKGWLPAVLKVECVIYQYTKQTPFGGPGLCLSGLRTPRRNNHDKLNKPANVHPQLRHRFTNGYFN